MRRVFEFESLRISFSSTLFVALLALLMSLTSLASLALLALLTLYFPCMLIVQVVLLNLLIAIMSSSHARIGTSAAMVARYQRAKLIVKLEPPPRRVECRFVDLTLGPVGAQRARAAERRRTSAASAPLARARRPPVPAVAPRAATCRGPVGRHRAARHHRTERGGAPARPRAPHPEPAAERAGSQAAGATGTDREAAARGGPLFCR